METIRTWLHSRTAGEVMTRKVLCLRDTDLLGDAISLFVREQISGAPVVDEDGVCVGVLSARDVLTFDEKYAEAAVAAGCSKRSRKPFDVFDPGSEWWLEFGRVREEIEPKLGESVSDHMTRDIVGVTKETPMIVVLRQMIDAHLHRILVLDAGRRICGIVTTTDVIAALLRAGRGQ